MPDDTPKKAPEIPDDELKFPDARLDAKHPKLTRFVLISLIIVLVCILIGLLAWLYLMQTQPIEAPVPSTRPTAEENNEPESDTAEARTEAQQVTSPSTELSSIETDLNGTQFTNLDPLFADIEALFE